MKHASRWFGALCGAFMLAGAACKTAQHVTEIVLVIDTDLRVPQELDRVQVAVTGPVGDTRQVEEVLSSSDKLPLRLGIQYGGGAVGGLRVVVAGLRGAQNPILVVQRAAEVDFVANQILTLHLDLLRACEGVMCPADQTCAPKTCTPGGSCSVACRTTAVARTELSPWSGPPPRQLTSPAASADAATSGTVDAAQDASSRLDAAGASGTGATSIPGIDAAPATLTDASAQTSGRDASPPTSCFWPSGAACGGTGINSISACVVGRCIVVCNTGFADCNGVAADGCEVDVATDSKDCGSCGHKCSICCTGQCGIGKTCP
ncbi:MAG TPA: hypothetical protein VF331_22660 [Polyangiales bacterium]